MSKENKDKKWPKFKLPKRRQPIFSFFKKLIFRPLYGCKFESMIEQLPEKAIFPSIHSAKKGPISITVTYPKFNGMWGHHGMLGNYAERFKYLRNTLYIQKLHKGKFIATVKATYEAIFSIFIYKGMHVIGTYTDMRFLQTVRNSMEFINSGASLFIFPEDSSEGYFDEIKAAFPGFVMLAETYYQRYGEDLPLIPTYISLKKKRLIVGKPRYARALMLEGKSMQEIADILKEDINALYRDYILTDKPVEVCVKDAEPRPKSYYGE